MGLVIKLLPTCATRIGAGAGLCTANDIVQAFVNFMRLLLGFVGAAVLLMFVYGGFVWLTSGGNPEGIKKGQAIVKNAFIGLVVVFGAYTAIQFLYTSFAVRPEFKVGQECSAGASSNRGIYIQDPRDPKRVICATACGQQGLNDYACTVAGSEGDRHCVYAFGLCPADQVCCRTATSSSP